MCDTYHVRRGEVGGEVLAERLVLWREDAVGHDILAHLMRGECGHGNAGPAATAFCHFAYEVLKDGTEVPDQHVVLPYHAPLGSE